MGAQTKDLFTGTLNVCMRAASRATALQTLANISVATNVRAWPLDSHARHCTTGRVV